MEQSTHTLLEAQTFALAHQGTGTVAVQLVYDERSDRDASSRLFDDRTVIVARAGSRHTGARSRDTPDRTSMGSRFILPLVYAPTNKRIVA
jgi:hypothetical protein